ncbi:MAG: PadR family transcriptional regulator [Terracidiphilus sp.]|jgi:DNA-binding PadR family transcriptional regulator
MKTSSNLELALLGLLRQMPQSGYDLRKTFATTAMRHFSDSPGSIYPALRRLEARGWIAAPQKSLNELADPRKRQVFHLTAEGESSLVAWLERPVTREDVIWRLPELMLRFAFMDGNVPRSAALRFLGDFEQALAAYAGELRADFERISSQMPLSTGLLAFQSGIEGFEAQLSWVRQARARLAEDAR